MFSGASALRAPVTRICNCTVAPTAASELLKTAVTPDEAADVLSVSKNTTSATKTAIQNRDPDIDISINHPLCPPTSRYRHGAQPCVHQVARALLRPSSTAKATLLDVRSFDLPFPVRPRRSAHSYRAIFLTRPCQLLLLRRPIFFGAILLELL